MKRTILMLSAALLLGLAGCADDPAGAPAPVVASVSVAPAAITLSVGDTVRVAAVPRAANGNPVDGAALVWEGEAGGVVSLSGEGNSRLVTALAAGTTRIKASVAGKTGTVDITVTAPPPAVASITITPAAAEVAVGGQLPLTAVLKAADGQVLEGRPVEWISTRPALALVIRQNPETSAVLHAAMPGSVVVRATSGTVQAEAQFELKALPAAVASIELNPAGGNLQVGGATILRAITRAADGTRLDGRAVQWSSSNAAVVEVTPQAFDSLAIVRGVAVGAAIVTAQSEGVRRDVVFTVTAPPQPVPVAHVFIRPNPAGIWAGYTRKFAAYTLSAGGTPLNRPVTWSVADPLIARVDSTGLVTGLIPGVTRLIAESEGKRDYAEVHVYENTPRLTMALTYDWWDGQIHLAEPMGTALYIDDQGVSRTATLYAYYGSLTVDRNGGTYERVIRAEAWAQMGADTRKVAEQTFTDRGSVSFRWDPENSTTFEFVSATTPGLRYQATPRGPGELVVSLPIFGGQIRDLLFRIP